MFGLGPWELAIIFLIVLVVFGPKSLPRIGQSLGKGIREFKDAARGLTADLDEEVNRPRPEIAQKNPDPTPDVAGSSVIDSSAPKA